MPRISSRLLERLWKRLLSKKSELSEPPEYIATTCVGSMGGNREGNGDSALETLRPGVNRQAQKRDDSRNRGVLGSIRPEPFLHLTDNAIVEARAYVGQYSLCRFANRADITTSSSIRPLKLVGPHVDGDAGDTRIALEIFCCDHWRFGAGVDARRALF